MLVCSCLQLQSTATEAEKAIWLKNNRKKFRGLLSTAFPAAVKSGLNYSKSAIVSAVLKIVLLNDLVLTTFSNYCVTICSVGQLFYLAVFE